MPVAPAYQGGSGMGWGGDWAWIIILLLAFGGGWGGGFGGGYGNMMLGYDFPWLMSGQNGINANTNAGFRDAQISDQITSVRDGISDISTQLCSGFAGVNSSITNAQMANMQSLFGVQSALSQCLRKILDKAIEVFGFTKNEAVGTLAA